MKNREWPKMPKDKDGKPIPGFEAEGCKEIEAVLTKWAARHAYGKVSAQVTFHDSRRPLEDMAPTVVLIIALPRLGPDPEMNTLVTGTVE